MNLRHITITYICVIHVKLDIVPRLTFSKETMTYTPGTKCQMIKVRPLKAAFKFVCIIREYNMKRLMAT